MPVCKPFSSHFASSVQRYNKQIYKQDERLRMQQVQEQRSIKFNKTIQEKIEPIAQTLSSKQQLLLQESATCNPSTTFNPNAHQSFNEQQSSNKTNKRERILPPRTLDEPSKTSSTT